MRVTCAPRLEAAPPHQTAPAAAAPPVRCRTTGRVGDRSPPAPRRTTHRGGHAPRLLSAHPQLARSADYAASARAVHRSSDAGLRYVLGWADAHAARGSGSSVD